jgi:hypothetical protein
MDNNAPAATPPHCDQKIQAAVRINGKLNKLARCLIICNITIKWRRFFFSDFMKSAGILHPL